MASLPREENYDTDSGPDAANVVRLHSTSLLKGYGKGAGVSRVCSFGLPLIMVARRNTAHGDPSESQILRWASAPAQSPLSSRCSGPR